LYGEPVRIAVEWPRRQRGRLEADDERLAAADVDVETAVALLHRADRQELGEPTDQLVALVEQVVRRRAASPPRVDDVAVQLRDACGEIVDLRDARAYPTARDRTLVLDSRVELREAIGERLALRDQRLACRGRRRIVRDVVHRGEELLQ